MSSNSPDYHLAELRLAQSTGDIRRILPEIPPACQRVLDVGCGAGQTLLACARPGLQAVGMDFDQDALQLGKKLQVPAHLLRGTGEALPFRDASFDLVYSRVALPYMDIPRAVGEMARVLVPGGQLWLTLHPLSMLHWGEALSHPRKILYEAYRLLNTGLLHWGGFQIRYPLRRSRTESYQTKTGMRLVLQAKGCEQIQFPDGNHFLVTARKR